MRDSIKLGLATTTIIGTIGVILAQDIRENWLLYSPAFDTFNKAAANTLNLFDNTDEKIAERFPNAHQKISDKLEHDVFPNLHISDFYDIEELANLTSARLLEMVLYQNGLAPPSVLEIERANNYADQITRTLDENPLNLYNIPGQSLSAALLEVEIDLDREITTGRPLDEIKLSLEGTSGVAEVAGRIAYHIGAQVLEPISAEKFDNGISPNRV